jgi:hypothetical protein
MNAARTAWPTDAPADWRGRLASRNIIERHSTDKAVVGPDRGGYDQGRFRLPILDHALLSQSACRTSRVHLVIAPPVAVLAPSRLFTAAAAAAVPGAVPGAFRASNCRPSGVDISR